MESSILNGISGALGVTFCALLPIMGFFFGMSPLACGGRQIFMVTSARFPPTSEDNGGRQRNYFSRWLVTNNVYRRWTRRWLIFCQREWRCHFGQEDRLIGTAPKGWYAKQDLEAYYRDLQRMNWERESLRLSFVFYKLKSPIFS